MFMDFPHTNILFPIIFCEKARERTASWALSCLPPWRRANLGANLPARPAAWPVLPPVRRPPPVPHGPLRLGGINMNQRGFHEVV